MNAAASAPESRPPQIPGYELQALLGRGGMAEVWRARRLSDAREAACKFMLTGLATERHLVVRFEKESAAMAALDHPNVVRLLDRGVHRGACFLSMEFVDGSDLRQLIRRTAPSAGETLRIAHAILAALDHAHRRGIVHRDLKPANVLVTRDGQVKLADFGIAHIHVEGLERTETGMVMGTARYMSPEQQLGLDIDGRADLFSLGVMLYEMLSRMPPVGRFRPPSQVAAGLDPRVDDLVMRALESDRRDRFPSAAAMARHVETLVSDAALPFVPATAPERAPEEGEARTVPARGGARARLDVQGTRVRLELADGATPSDVARVTAELERALAAAGPVQLLLELARLRALAPAEWAALGATARRNAARLSRIAVAARVSTVRGGALVLLDGLKPVPSVILPTVDEAQRWLEGGAR